MNWMIAALLLACVSLVGDMETCESYDATADEYERKISSHFYTGDLDRFLKHLSNGSKVLDIGCGPGLHAAYLSENGANVTGIDFSKKMIERAKINAPKATFSVMEIENLNFPEKYFDAIWCSASLLHIPKNSIPLVLRKISSLMNDEGIFYVSFKQGDGEEMANDTRYGGVPKFWAYYNEDELHSLLTSAGFTILSSFIYQPSQSHHTHPYITIFAKKQATIGLSRR